MGLLNIGRRRWKSGFERIEDRSTGSVGGLDDGEDPWQNEMRLQSDCVGLMSTLADCGSGVKVLNFLVFSVRLGGYCDMLLAIKTMSV